MKVYIACLGFILGYVDMHTMTMREHSLTTVVVCSQSGLGNGVETNVPNTFYIKMKTLKKIYVLCDGTAMWIMRITVFKIFT